MQIFYYRIFEDDIFNEICSLFIGDRREMFKFARKTDRKFINDSSIFLKLKLRKIKNKEIQSRR